MKASGICGSDLSSIRIGGISREPADADAPRVRKTALEALAAAGTAANLSETMWLNAEMTDADARLAAG